MDGTHRLRVLVADHRHEQLFQLAILVVGLGHTVIARRTRLLDVTAVTSRVRPDIALVGVGERTEQSLDLIEEIVDSRLCPVIALLDAYDAEVIDRTAVRGIYAYVAGRQPERLRSAIEITLWRCAEAQRFRGASEQQRPERRVRKRQLLDVRDADLQGLVATQVSLALVPPQMSQQPLHDTRAPARGSVTRSTNTFRHMDASPSEILTDPITSQ